jgi:hypothetical protein
MKGSFVLFSTVKRVSERDGRLFWGGRRKRKYLIYVHRLLLDWYQSGATRVVGGLTRIESDWIGILCSQKSPILDSILATPDCGS